MRLIPVVAVVAALAWAQVAKTSPSFSGRWRIADPASVTETVAYELVVTETGTPATISIERQFPSGTRVTRFAIAVPAGSADAAASNSAARPSAAFRNVATWLGAALVMPTAGASSPAGTLPPAEHEEAWSLAGTDTLYVDVTDRVAGGAPKTTHVSYRRVAVPDSVRAGRNLLDNPGADQGAAFWLASGDAKREPCDGDPCFVIRNQGSFQQTVALPKDVVGKYVVMVGSGSSERMNPDGAITGLPTLYAIVATADGVRIVAHLQGQEMRGRPTATDTWFKMSGVFLMPEGASRLYFKLNQAERAGVPQNGSAARFDQLGLYVFPSEPEARAFVAAWPGRGGGQP